MSSSKAVLAGRLAVLALVAATGAAGAQQVYRIVGPDGKVTFSDKPPVETGAKAAPAAAAGGRAGGAIASGSLPFELRQVASRYPVTLYAGPNCVPCGAGRSYLSQRGIPFVEKTVSSQDDVEAFARLSGGSPALPLLTVGAQQLKGYSETEWSQFLDAAGYPRNSLLPASYRPPAATPLVMAQPIQPEAPAAAAEPAAATRAPARAPQQPGGSNPAGITF
ncbi:glutaredoxin family protein [Ramlibacter henchirensis]|uniref:Glutaredoxin family protein n=1 Tax=Ramlibacter henchirensis TaxID=204072 RepID=A0A4Z0BR31_9BURK|nr:glutaredoxin family protein [Ramlibacter henchirensis]TFZ00708.1 glutaredoxin family protein [Ramlibacter henchirensis]